jgi:hypothetical protein
MAETGLAIAPEEFLDILAPAYARWDHQLATYGFAPIRRHGWSAPRGWASYHCRALVTETMKARLRG